MCIIFSNHQNPLLIILIWLNLCSFWILERRFGSFSILQISLWTGNFYYLTGLDNLLSNLAPLPGIQGNYFIISRSHLTLTIVFVLVFEVFFQVEFGWNWVKGILSRFWFGKVSLIDLYFGTLMENVILRKNHYLQWGHPYISQIPSFRPLFQFFKIFNYFVG